MIKFECKNKLWLKALEIPYSRFYAEKKNKTWNFYVLCYVRQIGNIVANWVCKLQIVEHPLKAPNVQEPESWGGLCGCDSVLWKPTVFSPQSRPLRLQSLLQEAPQGESIWIRIQLTRLSSPPKALTSGSPSRWVDLNQNLGHKVVQQKSSFLL